MMLSCHDNDDWSSSILPLLILLHGSVHGLLVGSQQTLFVTVVVYLKSWAQQCHSSPKLPAWMPRA